jgi:hypothetical protein
VAIVGTLLPFAFGCALQGSEVSDDPLTHLVASDSIATAAEIPWAEPPVDIVFSAPPEGFGSITAIAVTVDGKAFVYDGKAPARRRVLYLYDAAGNMVRQIGRAGLGPGEYSSQNPLLVSLDSGRVLISDVILRRFLVYDTAGALVADFSGPEYYGARVGRAAGGGFWRNSRIVTPPDSVTEVWIRYTVHGVPGDTAKVPQWAVGPVTRADFMPRIASLIDPDGRLTATWTGRLRFVRETPAGLFAFAATIEPIAYLPQERQDLQTVVDFAVPRIAQVGRLATKVPPTKPVIRALRGLDWNANLWVTLHAPSFHDSSQPARDPSSLPPGMSGYAWAEPDRIARFRPDGRFSGGATLPIGSEFLRGQDSLAWGTRLSESSEIEVVRWKIPSAETSRRFPR